MSLYLTYEIAMPFHIKLKKPAPDVFIRKYNAENIFVENIEDVYQGLPRVNDNWLLQRLNTLRNQIKLGISPRLVFEAFQYLRKNPAINRAQKNIINTQIKLLKFDLKDNESLTFSHFIDDANYRGALLEQGAITAEEYDEWLSFYKNLGFDSDSLKKKMIMDSFPALALESEPHNNLATNVINLLQHIVSNPALLLSASLCLLQTAAAQSLQASNSSTQGNHTSLVTTHAASSAVNTAQTNLTAQSAAFAAAPAASHNMVTVNAENQVLLANYRSSTEFSYLRFMQLHESLSKKLFDKYGKEIEELHPSTPAGHYAKALYYYNLKKRGGYDSIVEVDHTDASFLIMSLRHLRDAVASQNKLPLSESIFASENEFINILMEANDKADWKRKILLAAPVLNLDQKLQLHNQSFIDLFIDACYDLAAHLVEINVNTINNNDEKLRLNKLTNEILGAAVVYIDKNAIPNKFVKLWKRTKKISDDIATAKETTTSDSKSTIIATVATVLVGVGATFFKMRKKWFGQQQIISQPNSIDADLETLREQLSSISDLFTANAWTIEPSSSSAIKVIAVNLKTLRTHANTKNGPLLEIGLTSDDIVNALTNAYKNLYPSYAVNYDSISNKLTLTVTIDPTKPSIDVVDRKTVAKQVDSLEARIAQTSPTLEKQKTEEENSRKERAIKTLSEYLTATTALKVEIEKFGVVEACRTKRDSLLKDCEKLITQLETTINNHPLQENEYSADLLTLKGRFEALNSENEKEKKREEKERAKSAHAIPQPVPVLPPVAPKKAAVKQPVIIAPAPKKAAAPQPAVAAPAPKQAAPKIAPIQPAPAKAPSAPQPAAAKEYARPFAPKRTYTMEEWDRLKAQKEQRKENLQVDPSLTQALHNFDVVGNLITLWNDTTEQNALIAIAEMVTSNPDNKHLGISAKDLAQQLITCGLAYGMMRASHASRSHIKSQALVDLRNCLMHQVSLNTLVANFSDVITFCNESLKSVSASLRNLQHYGRNINEFKPEDITAFIAQLPKKPEKPAVQTLVQDIFSYGKLLVAIDSLANGIINKEWGKDLHHLGTSQSDKLRFPRCYLIAQIGERFQQLFKLHKNEYKYLLNQLREFVPTIGNNKITKYEDARKKIGHYFGDSGQFVEEDISPDELANLIKVTKDMVASAGCQKVFAAYEVTSTTTSNSLYHELLTATLNSETQASPAKTPGSMFYHAESSSSSSSSSSSQHDASLQHKR